MNIGGPPPHTQLHGGPCKQASSKWGSARSLEPLSRYLSESGQTSLFIVICALSLFTQIPWCIEESPATKNQLSEAKTKPLLGLPFHFWEKGHRMNTWLLVCWGTWREEVPVV